MTIILHAVTPWSETTMADQDDAEIRLSESIDKKYNCAHCDKAHTCGEGEHCYKDSLKYIRAMKGISR